MTRSPLSRTSICAKVTLFAFALLLAGFTTSAAAQSFQVLHDFTFGPDGSTPSATVTVDQRGNLYGTTTYGGANNRGTVFKLTHRGSGWVFSPLYDFADSDGQFTEAPLAIGPDGTLFGTTLYGGAVGSGTVYNVRPPSNPCRSVLCPWTETVLHSFTGQPDGSEPGYGALVFDPAGNGYGTTTNGGVNNGGVVYVLARSQQGWTESVAYTLSDLHTGTNPYGGLIFDGAGNLYGTASSAGGNGAGAVYQLSQSGSGWTGMFLYTFPIGDLAAGGAPYGGVIFDAAGNFYGTTTAGGANGQGTVYELTPSGGSWTESVLYSFGGTTTIGPENSLAMDAAGNLYGTTFQGGAYQGGTVFRLSPSNGQWIYTDLHDFTGGEGGQFPIGGVAIDANGNLFGTTEIGGSTSSDCTDGCGVVWEIAP
jgi:uncharacterized repeat protein (TIGR03803 family)